MKVSFATLFRYVLAVGSVASLGGGVLVAQSCGGEGGPVSGNAPGTDTSLTRQFQALLPAGQAGATFVGPNRCADCHNGQTGGEAYFDHWTETVHKTKNVTCENCHGPGSNHVAAPAKTNILTFPKSTSAVVCGQCHGPIYDQWMASKHRQIVLDPVEEAGQNPAVYGRSSRCIVCHSGLMRAQYVEKGVDVGTLSDAQIREVAENTTDVVPNIANCATCHNPHAVTGNLDGDGEEHQIRHKTFNTDTSQIGPGTTAAQFTTFDHICAECHNGRGSDPTDAKLTTGTARPSMHDSPQFNMLMGVGGVEGSGPIQRTTSHATVPGQCSHCHMPDASHTFTVQYDKSCQPCHTAADAAARVAAVKGEIVNGMYALLSRMQSWSQTTFGDRDLWDYTSNIAAEGKTPPNQSLVPIQVKRARHNYFFLIRDNCFGPHNSAYSRLLLQVANDNLDAIGVPPGAPGGPDGRSAGPSYQEKLAVLERSHQLTRQADLSGLRD